MHNRLLPVAALALAAAACTRPAARDAGPVVVHDAWVRSADSGATTAAYFRLVNTSSRPVTVTGFASDAARTVELHESMSDEHMMMHMTPKAAVTIAAGDSVTLRPNGMHLMLIGTTRSLTAGANVRLDLRLSTGTTISTSADVRAP